MRSVYHQRNVHLTLTVGWSEEKLQALIHHIDATIQDKMIVRKFHLCYNEYRLGCNL